MHDELLNDFLEESADLIEKVKAALLQWEATSDKEEAINSIYRWVHTIKGGCGIFEYKETAHVAHELESFLGELRKRPGEITSDEIQHVSEAVADIEESFHGQGSVKPQESSGEFHTRYFSSWFESSGEIAHDLMKDGFHFFEVVFPSEIFDKISEKLTEHDITVVESAPAGNQRAALCSVSSEEKKPKAQILIDKFEGQWCSSNAALPAEKSNPEKPAETQEVLRVPLVTVNSILDHIWELFLVRNQMAHLFSENKHIFKDHHSFIQQFEALDNVIERNIHALESKTMSLRLSPIKKVFDRMDKVVKEYCQEAGKKIRLVKNGEGIDLDKKVLDQLNEPLIHLIRNAIDHGIESLEDRTRSGKTSEGTVTLSAQIQGSEVSIVISDDGKGIDPRKILESARKKNLETSHLKTEQDILELIFAPGFSTAEKVTNVSGRGVGMDAVRNSIKDLGGNVHLETELGTGTRFRINLPLTMSVSKSLIVNVRGIDYAIPTKSVIFVEKVSVHHLKYNGKDAFYEFEKELIPCFNLGDLLPDYRKEPDLPITHTHVCVTTVNNQRMAFRVDEILQTLNVVLKPLPGTVRKHPYIGGVSILPGGNPIFVLNVYECLGRAKKGDSHVKRVA